MAYSLFWLQYCHLRFDFIDDSHGFRPGRSCHDALRALSQTVEGGQVHCIVDADIKGFFDNVDHIKVKCAREEPCA